MHQVKDHFSSPQWVDLVRGRLPEDVAAEMDVHLRSGCTDCMAAFDVWQGLAVFAEEERASTPPDDAIRVAKSYLAQPRMARAEPAQGHPIAAWASATVATLVFDSRQAVPAGVRAAAAFSRHLVFDAKSLVVDLRIDTGSRAGGLLLSGQVADTSRPEQPLEHIWLSLVDNRQEISMFQTNEFGEFQCTFDRRRNLTLMIYGNGSVVAIPLDVLFDPSNARSGHSDNGR